MHGQSEVLTEDEVAAESRGKMPPQAMMRLSTTWEMRWMLLWTNTTFSLLFTKSRIVLVEWLHGKIQRETLFTLCSNLFVLNIVHIYLCSYFKNIQ